MTPSVALVRTVVSVAACGVVALAACSAAENKESVSSQTPSTGATVTKPRTTPSASVPTPPPVSDEDDPTGAVSLELAQRGDLGEIVVDGTGHAVYVFSLDRPGVSTCYDACARTWPPVLDDDHPGSGVGIDVAAAQTVKRRDGTSQVTYMGWPLYHYAGDQSDKDANGQAFAMFGGVWHVLTKQGRPLA